MRKVTEETENAADDNRVALARLQLIIASLGATVVFSPALSVLLALALTVPGSPLGPIGWPDMAGMMALQLALSALTWHLMRRYENVTARDVPRVETRMILLQAAISAGWVLTAWLCWQNGQTVNNVFVTIMMALVVLAASLARAAHMRVMLTAVLVQSIGMALLLALARGHVAHVMLASLPFFVAYVILTAHGARSRVNAMVQARVAADDMARALAAAHQEALRKRYEAEAANASKTAFLANMSHELRTPLNAILGFSDIIANQSFGPDTVRYAEYARDIHSSGAHLLSLINDLLDVAKIESGKMEIDPAPLDPRLTIENVARIVAPKLAAKKQLLTLAAERDLPMVMADERALKQMLLNLLSNAMKFTQEGGEIALGCCRGAEGGITVIVQDNGPGIAPEKLSRVFQPFSQIDNRYDRQAGGTGLGLALVRGLAELHGGRVWLESAPGEGVKACIYFPSTIEPRATRRRAEKVQAGPAAILRKS